MCSICPAVMGSRAMAIGHYPGGVRAGQVCYGLERSLALGLWVDRGAGSTGLWPVCTAVYHLTRLRAWLFFSSRRANQWVGACLGLITLNPNKNRKKTHAVHH